MKPGFTLAHQHSHQAAVLEEVASQAAKLWNFTTFGGFFALENTERGYLPQSGESKH